MPRRLNRFGLAGGIMCSIANLFAVVALSSPSWVVTEFLGSVRFGLTMLCQEPLAHGMICVTPTIPSSWKATLLFVILGILSLTCTCVLSFVSPWKQSCLKYAKWVAIVSLANLCMAAIVFPIGFESPEIGGEPFKLPTNTALGSSYTLFILSIIFTLFGGVCMRKCHTTVL